MSSLGAKNAMINDVSVWVSLTSFLIDINIIGLENICLCKIGDNNKVALLTKSKGSKSNNKNSTYSNTLKHHQPLINNRAQWDFVLCLN